MENFNIFVPIAKIDAAKRLVYGLATAEQVDSAGEMCDYESTKPHYEKWSGDIQKASGGKSLGNLRAMHGKVAAGKVTDIAFNDDAKQIEICAKVVDDGEWKKVEEGVYTGFSQGGRYVKRWKDDAGVQRYTADPVEVSLVDVPCLPSATFEVVKDNGETEMRKFATVAKAPTNDEINAKATEIAKAAGDETKWADHIDEAREALVKAASVTPMDGLPTEENGDPDPALAEGDGSNKTPIADPANGDEWEQVWRSKRDGECFKTKAELRKHHEDMDAEKAASEATGAANSKLDALEEALGIEKRKFSDKQRKEMAANGEAMKDGSYPIANKEDLENAIHAYGRAKDKASAKRHIIRRAKAMGMTDMLPADWSGSTKDKAKKANEGAGLEKLDTPELKKAATLSSVSSLLMLAASLECAEERLEGENGGYWVDYDTGTTRVDVPKEMTDRFGSLLVEFGDLVADILDEVLTAIGREESEEAMQRSRPVLDLIKAGARHSSADIKLLQGAHDALAKLGAECDPATKAGEPEDLSKTADSEELAKLKGENEAMKKQQEAFEKRLDAILENVSKMAKQSTRPILRVAEKTDDQATGQPQDEVMKQVQAILSDPDRAADIAFRIAQANGRPLIER